MGEIDQKLQKIVGNCNPSWMVSRAGTVEQISVKCLSGRLICRRLKNKCNVLIPNGEVYLCCMDYGLKHYLGNLLTDKYGDLYKGDEFKKILKAINSKDGEVICRYCEKAKLIK